MSAATPHSSARQASAASSEPSTTSLGLLASIQQLLQSTHSLSASYHHSLSQLTARLHALDDRTARLLNEQHRLRLGLEWLREKGQLLPSSPLPTPAQSSAAPTATQDLTTTLFSLFTQQQPAFTSRPFSYHTELCYRRLLHTARRHPRRIVPAALAEASPAVLVEQRRWLGGLCRGLVCDVMGDGRGAVEGDGSGASSVALIEATLIRMQAVMRRRTEKRRAEDEEARRERDREDTERRQAAQLTQQSADTPERIEDDNSSVSTPTASTSPLPGLSITTTPSTLTSLLSSTASDIPILPPSSAYAFSVLDHSSLPLKLLHEFNLRYASRYLQATLAPSIALVLDEQHTDLNIDLMGPSPRSADGLAAAAGGGSGAGEKLFGICGHLMDAIVSSAVAMPPGMRRLARLLFRLGSAASPAATPSSTSTTGLMSSPSSPYRLVSDYLFLNYLINALMHPSSYSLLPLSSSPLSPLHRRNLQVVATVLIKVMSGSRFVFEGGRLQQLNEAVEEWRERVIRFIDGLVADDDDDETATDEAEAEEAEEGGEGGWEEEGAAEGDEAVDRVIAMLPNDLFCLHHILLGWKRDAVERGRAQRQAERDRRKTSPPNPLPSPTAASAASPSLSPLVALLVSMDDPPPYLSLADNLYLLLSSGFPTLVVPPLPPFPSSSRTERLCADMLSYVLSTLPRFMLPNASSSASASSVLTVLAAEAQRAESTGNAATAITVTECIALLSSAILPADLPAFLSAMHVHLQSYHSLLASSPLPSRLLLCAGEAERRQEELKRQEVEVRDGLRGLGVRRTMEMVRLRVKRLRKFLAQRSDKEKDKLASAAAQQPADGAPQLLDSQQARDRRVSAPSSSPLYVPPPPAYLSTLLTGGGCSGVWPADVQADRFLCAGCMRLLDKRRVLLRSFYNKYVVGEPNGATTDGGLSGFASPSLAVPLPLAPAVSSPATFASHSTASAATTAGATVGTEPGFGHALLNLSLGPPLNLLDVAVQCDLNDLICSAVWDEVWVDCERGEKQWWVECEALRRQLLPDEDEAATDEAEDGGRVDADETMRRAFGVWYALMALGEREVGGESGVTVADVRRQLRRTQREQSTTEAETPLQRKLQQLVTPWLSSHTLAAFERELYCMLRSKSCRDKLDCIGRMRFVVFATLANGSMIALRRQQQGATAPSDVEAGSVDDYMALLSFLLVWLNPLGLLPHLSFLRLLHTPAAQHKAAVDVLTACKYVYFMQQSVVSAQAGAAAAAEFAAKANELRQRVRGGGVRPGSSAGGAGGADSVAMGRSASQPSGLTVHVGARQFARSLSSLDE